MQQGYKSCKSASCNGVAGCNVIAGVLEKANTEEDVLGEFDRLEFDVRNI